MEFQTKKQTEALKMACELNCILQDQKKEPIFVCVGSDRVVSDCFGALVGELLIKKYNIPARVFGNLSYNITKKNFKSFLNYIKNKYPNHLIVIVDSALAEFESLNNVKVNNHGCVVAGGFGGETEISGDASILACVNMVGCNSLLFLKGSKLKNIFKLAKFVAYGIHLSFLMPKVS